MSRMREYYFVSEDMVHNLAREFIKVCENYNFCVETENASLASSEWNKLQGIMEALMALDIKTIIEWDDDNKFIKYFEFDVLDYGWYV